MCGRGGRGGRFDTVLEGAGVLGWMSQNTRPWTSNLINDVLFFLLSANPYIGIFDDVIDRDRRDSGDSYRVDEMYFEIPIFPESLDEECLHCSVPCKCGDKTQSAGIVRGEKGQLKSGPVRLGDVCRSSCQSRSVLRGWTRRLVCLADYESH